MARRQVQSNAVVGDVLARWPQVAQEFVNHHMGCVGCPMASFETLAEVAEAYEMEELHLVHLLEEAISGASYSKLHSPKPHRS